MNRKYIWLISCISAVLISFLLPWMVLSIMEYSEKKEISRSTVSGRLQDYGSLSIAQKQIILSSSGLAVSEDRSINPQDKEDLITAFRNEIDKLFDCGAITECMTQAFSQELHIQGMLALLPEDGQAFRYCEIYNETESAVAIFDSERQQILGLTLYGQMDQFQIDLGVSDDDSFEESVTEELRSWANYFACSAQDIYMKFEESSAGQIQIVGSIFSDGIDQYDFRLIYDLNRNSICWGASLEMDTISESEMNK